ncbi:MAG TPA: rod shape-determining protein RodA [Steroidobacteraceae bacterium]|nr:rod shape-determining protein RodA [Steroidobacteraceae bacterium]
MQYDSLDSSRTQRTLTLGARLLFELHLDGVLLTALCLTAAIGMAIVYSSSDGNWSMTVAQGLKFLLALVAMIVLAQVPPRVIRASAPILFAVGVILLVAVMIGGDVVKGARRWLNIGFRFQPSELMKLAVPLFCAWYLHDRPLPPSLGNIVLLLVAIAVPSLLIARQPDLGTALLVIASGIMVIVLAGLRMRYIVSAIALFVGIAVAGTLLDWRFLQPYQRQRVLTLLDPASDPLGSGYHIIQSQIALGSGGAFGKGYLNGTQATLEFLPMRSTDFIFAVIGEEWGLLGLIAILLLYAFIIGRGLYLAATSQDTFARLIAGSISLTFAVYVLVNAGMVTGLLPVVGVPLPLISYGGSSLVTLMAGFGILMAVNARRRLVGR